MKDGDHVGDEVHRRLKTAILTGRLTFHSRLDLAALAQQYAVSLTPVREAVMRLLGEGLVEPHPKGGTRPFLITEHRLRALLDLHAKITIAATDWQTSATVKPSGYQSVALQDIEQKSRLVFGDLIDLSGNPETTLMIGQLSDRLALFRHFEGQLLPGVIVELDELHGAFGERIRLRRMLRAYHARRFAVVAPLVWLATTQNAEDVAD